MVGSKWRTWGNMTGALGWSSGYMLLPVIVYLIPDMKQLEGRNCLEFRCSEGGKYEKFDINWQVV